MSGPRLAMVGLAALVFVPMALEFRRATRNERRQRTHGALEPNDDVYDAMRFAYPASFLAMIAEGVLRDRATMPALIAGTALFAAAKALKWWAIVTLGGAWTFRILVVPGAPLVTRGPYRLLQHPNYIAVVGELIGTALTAGAAITGPVGTLAFGVLLWRRIEVENRALRTAHSGSIASK